MVVGIDPMWTVFGLILVAVVLFVTEVVPNDVTAIGVIVALVVFGVLDPDDAIGGFANTATVTIIAMYMLSAGIQNTGIVQRLGVRLAAFAKGRESRALLATVCTTGPIAGFVNNTPVVAVFIPMITDLAEETGTSPSRLLMPLSFAAILGGTLTLIGTSTNLLASGLAVEFEVRETGIGMFEFTGLGIVLLLVGVAYLLTIGRRLTPARIPVDVDLVDEFDLADHLAQGVVREDSELVGRRVDDLPGAVDGTITPLQLRRDGEVYAAPTTDQTIQPGDTLVYHGTLQAVNRFQTDYGLKGRPRAEVTDATFEHAATDNTLAKAVVPETSSYVGQTLAEARLEEFHGATVLAVRREGDLVRTGLDDVTLQAGDLLLTRLPVTSVEYFTQSGELVIVDDGAFDHLVEADLDEVAPLSPRAPLAIGIMLAVVGVAAFSPIPIVIAALGGVVAMVVTNCLSTAEAYDAVSWNVIFLLAGVIPLGIALQEHDGDRVIADLLATSDVLLPLIGTMLVVYVVTGLLANVVTPVATVVLMIPVTLEVAAVVGADPFAFLLLVMFAGATSFMTPIGYQTNLMVYGPGGYQFTDFLRVGGPLQLLLSVVTTIGVYVIWI